MSGHLEGLPSEPINRKATGAADSLPISAWDALPEALPSQTTTVLSGVIAAHQASR